MWLLETTTLKPQLFLGDSTPYYAILSHTWGSHDKLQNLAGYVKIIRCCAEAASCGFKYAWVDACCIDKTNSAELSERATECYVYLVDATDPSGFGNNRWFTRGWTLQELLAPCSVIFFDSDWNEIGTKASQAEFICHNYVAQRMSWATRRETAREEDLAYCLLGIFDISMPMVYGEGRKAFRQLQLEIMKESTDQSLFAFSYRLNIGIRPIVCHLLAESPSLFRECGTIQAPGDGPAPEYSTTNKGLRIELPLAHCIGGFYSAFLNLTRKVCNIREL
ncbi:hypothetical protein AOQ84DRAFT_400794 [Glonium stellatum]|uniref:Heterokaryon incompatibility domain-containing protein n=1 Tax=Glonium stellatum TaxID=574774 RepID=A0A8E2JN31_9PEZI|nr:hypothetical protein AOQ84DRAFT_400794 [Glonium stellatum]